MSTKRDAGMEVIKSVLDEEYFAKRATTESSFKRLGLERKTRGLILLGMLTALGKSAELKMHVVGAINNGCTVEEIEEVGSRDFTSSSII